MDQEPYVVRTKPGVDVKDALVIVGTPGLGLVGSIAAQYIVQHLQMPLVGGVYSMLLPTAASVQGGRPMPPIRIYAVERRTVLGFGAERLVVITSDQEIPADQAMLFADSLVEWAKRAKVRALVNADGIMVETEAEDDIVVGVAALDEGAQALEKQGVVPLAGGVAGGVTGALLQRGQRHDVNTLAMLAETAPGYPDAKAAARLVEILDRMVPGIKIDAAPLLKEAESIEQTVRHMKEQLETETQTGDTSGAMYR